MKRTTPAERLTIAAVTSGVIAVLAQLLLVKLLDAGYVDSRSLFYAAACLPAAIIAMIYSGSLATLAASTAGCLLGTVVFYKTAVQGGAVTDLGNDADWALLLVLNSVTIAIVGAACLLLRRRHTVHASETGAKNP